jgi:hypothetical protein
MEEGHPWIRRFGVVPEDPGFIYLLENQGRYKIGRSKSRTSRIKEARTWLPDMDVISVKPFWDVTKKEKLMHIGFARCWYAKEWFIIPDEGYRFALVDEFVAFSDVDRDRNSVDFIYWFNGGGMAEFVMEQCRQRVSLKKFLQNESTRAKQRSNKDDIDFI